MTVVSPFLPGWDHYWNRMGLHGEWWIADESPGGLGEREVWVDEAAIDMIARGDAKPAITLSAGPHDAREPWPDMLIGAVVRVNRHPALSVPVVYKIICRRWSQANDGRPYYVLAWPDLPSAARENPMAEPVTEPAEERGGERPDWDAARPGKPLAEKPRPETMTQPVTFDDGDA